MDTTTVVARATDLDTQIAQNRTLAQQHAAALNQLDVQHVALQGAKSETLSWLDKLNNLAKTAETIGAATGQTTVVAVAQAVEAGIGLVNEFANPSAPASTSN